MGVMKKCNTSSVEEIKYILFSIEYFLYFMPIIIWWILFNLSVYKFEPTWLTHQYFFYKGVENRAVACMTLSREVDPRECTSARPDDQRACLTQCPSDNKPPNTFKWRTGAWGDVSSIYVRKLKQVEHLQVHNLKHFYYGKG